MSSPRSVSDFNAGLYREHLEDAGFLGSLRRAWISNPEVAWMRVGEVEQRLLAHLDALAVGSDAAAAACEAALGEGDPEIVRAVAEYACAGVRGRTLAKVLDVAREGDERVIDAVGQALRLMLPPAWNSMLVAAAMRSAEPERSMLVEVAAYRRIPLDASAIESSGIPLPRGVLAAWVRRGSPPWRAQLEPWTVVDSDTRVGYETWVAALRTGARIVEPRLRACLTTDPAARLAFGLVAEADGPALLASLAREPGAGAQAIVALGILGDASCLPVLIEALERPTQAAAAAEALQLVTGAGAGDAQFVAEPLREDEMSDAELERTRATGRAPTHAGGQPYGTEVRRPSRDPAVWEERVARARPKLEPRRRYRLGSPLTPAIAVFALESPILDANLRRLLCDEFVVRYGVDFGLETDALVQEQSRRLAAMRDWAARETAPGGPGGYDRRITPAG